MLPMFSEQSSGWNRRAAARRSSTRHPVAAARRDVDRPRRSAALIRGRNRAKTSGSGVGRPVSRVARVQVDDRGPRLGRSDRALGDLRPA